MLQSEKVNNLSSASSDALRNLQSVRITRKRDRTMRTTNETLESQSRAILNALKEAHEHNQHPLITVIYGEKKPRALYRSASMGSAIRVSVKAVYDLLDREEIVECPDTSERIVQYQLKTDVSVSDAASVDETVHLASEIYYFHDTTLFERSFVELSKLEKRFELYLREKHSSHESEVVRTALEDVRSTQKTLTQIVSAIASADVNAISSRLRQMSNAAQETKTLDKMTESESATVRRAFQLMNEGDGEFSIGLCSLDDAVNATLEGEIPISFDVDEQGCTVVVVRNPERTVLDSSKTYFTTWALAD
jgi:hypothetical protein